MSESALPWDELSTEKTVVGCMILDASAIDVFRAKTSNLINPFGVFQDYRNEAIAKAILKLDEEGVPADYTMLMHYFQQGRGERPSDSQVLTASYICGLEKWVFSTRNAGYHIDALLKAMRLRDLNRHLSHLVDNTQDQSVDLESVIEDTTTKLRELCSSDVAATTPNNEITGRIIEGLFKGEETSSVRSFSPKLYQTCGAYPKGRMTLIPAVQGTGKTALALQEAFHAITALGKRALLYLMESDDEQVFVRFAAQRFGVDANLWRSQRFEAADFENANKARKAYEAMNGKLFTVCNRPMSGAEIEADVDMFRRNHGFYPDLIIVDHLNTLNAPKGFRGSSSDHGAVHENTMALWRAAAKSGAAMVVLMQLTKDYQVSAARGKKRPRPTMGDLKGSGTPAEKAKLIITIHDPVGDPDAYVQQHELIILKANDGGLGVARSIYIAPLTLHFEDTPTNRRMYADALHKYGFVAGEDEELPA